MSIYDISVNDIEGNSIKLSHYKGKVLLIVNTATGCGFTPQYEELESLYKQYKEDGLEILDFPCNQFGDQAPGTSLEIKQFCSINYGVSFQQFEKIDVNGENESKLYTLLKEKKHGIMNSKIKWNFTKFLIDRNGNIIKRYPPTTKPRKIETDIFKLLNI